MSDLGFRVRKTVTPLLAALALVALGACADSATAPSEIARGSDEIPPGPGESAPATHRRIDEGATRAKHLIPVSSTPMGAPPESWRGKPQRDEGQQGVNPPMPQEQRVDVHNDEQANASSTKPLILHTGAVQTAPKIYLVFWGPNWFTGGMNYGDPFGVASRLHYFYLGLGGSSWANVLKQLWSPYGTFTNPAGQYKGWAQDFTPVPANPTQAQMAAAAVRAANYFKDFSYNAQYVIATPWGVIDQKSNAQPHACGWHSYTYAGPSGSWITYTSLPYTPYIDAGPAPFGCGTSKVNGAGGQLDGVTIIASHEYGETVSNPGQNAWYDVDVDENGDKCAWTNLANYKLTNGYSFPVQPLWSNLWKTQYNNGCLYSQ